jgi:hypothetical protein
MRRGHVQRFAIMYAIPLSAMNKTKNIPMVKTVTFFVAVAVLIVITALALYFRMGVWTAYSFVCSIIVLIVVLRPSRWNSRVENKEGRDEN